MARWFEAQHTIKSLLQDVFEYTRLKLVRYAYQRMVCIALLTS